MNNAQQPAPRRGLGRGLGSLIPTGPSPVSAPAQPGARSEDMGAGSALGARVGGAHAAVPAGVATRPVAVHGGSLAVEDSASRQDRPAEVSGAYFAELPVTTITPNARQPRQDFDEEAMAELVHSIKEVGLLQPVVVRRTGDSSYELIMGERRWRATQQAGLDTIPAIVRQTGDDDMLRDALLENLHRSELNPLEEAAAYRQLLDDFGCTHDELAGRIGRSRPQISNTLRLLNLSPAVQRRVAAGVLSAGHARALLGVTEPAAQDRLAGRVVSEGISVRGLEELVAVGELGEDEDDQRLRVRAPRPTAPGLSELGERLSDRLDTRVKVDLGRSKGKISIEFASLTDLERIVAVIDPRNRDDRPI
jgi:ParB family chromosome partitioning protein